MARQTRDRACTDRHDGSCGCCWRSDIDDTLLSVLFDTRYPELTVYPGVHQFVYEVQRLARADGDRASDDDDEDSTVDADEAQRKGAGRLTKHQRITFLTARPEILRKRSTRELRACGFANFTRTSAADP